MKKIVLAVFAISATFLFTSCGDFWDELFGKITGTATVTTAGERTEYTSSIVMKGTNASVPFYVGLAMVMDIEDLMDVSSADEIEFPMLCYRITGNNLTSGTTLTANNVLSEEDLVDFDYTTMFSGKFADNQVVGIALSDTKFYVLNTGTIKLDKVKKAKVSGSFSGRAYVIDRNADPMLSKEQVSISGSFVSRVVPMMSWVNRLQEKQ